MNDPSVQAVRTTGLVPTDAEKQRMNFPGRNSEFGQRGRGESGSLGKVANMGVGKL